MTTVDHEAVAKVQTVEEITTNGEDQCKDSGLQVGQDAIRRQGLHRSTKDSAKLDRTIVRWQKLIWLMVLAQTDDAR